MTHQPLLDVDPQNWEVEQVIVMDWYDGPRSGFCRLKNPEIDIEFKLLDERATVEGLDDRLFSLYIMPDGAFSTIFESLAFAGPPARPVWAPSWQSVNQLTLNEAERAIERARQFATPTPIIIRTPDFVHILGRWELATPTKVRDWFSFLGLISPN